ncbi:MAG: class I SAM-dependent methyltransferase [Gaiellaceae bacterium]
MTSCCTPDCGRFFNRRVAGRDARRYRSRGLTATAAELVALAGDADGASVLEVGGGIGAIELELLAGGARTVTNVELSPAYEQEAEALLAERGATDRARRLVGDFVAEAAAIEPHDVVVMHRVVCCYPDADALVGLGAARAHRRLLLTYPQERAVVRAGVRAINAFLALGRGSFRVHVHPVERMQAVAGAHGLTLERRVRRGLLWESASYVRG